MVGTLSADARIGQRARPFSTLGRVVMVGTAMRLSSATTCIAFQYPLSGRDGWNGGSAIGAERASASFSTLGRVVMVGTAQSAGRQTQ